MRLKMWLVAITIAGGLTFGNVDGVTAQELCGTECTLCGGYQFTAGNQAIIAIKYAGGCEWIFCADCEYGVESDLGAQSLSPLDIARALDAASNRQFTALAEQHGDRLLLNLERGLVVVKTDGECSEGLGAVVTVSAQRAIALQRMGLTSMERWYASVVLPTNPVPI